jgi:hypothetical protein
VQACFQKLQAHSRWIQATLDATVPCLWWGLTCPFQLNVVIGLWVRVWQHWEFGLEQAQACTSKDIPVISRISSYQKNNIQNKFVRVGRKYCLFRVNDSQFDGANIRCLTLPCVWNSKSSVSERWDLAAFQLTLPVRSD